VLSGVREIAAYLRGVKRWHRALQALRSILEGHALLERWRPPTGADM